MKPMTKNNIDWMGLWYDIIKERGENDRPTFGRLNLVTDKVDWMDFSHRDMDGIGAMMSFYRSHDLRYPRLKENKLPNTLEKISIFYRLLFKTKKLKTKWNEHNYNLEPLDPLKISYYIFSEEETKAIEDHCKKKHFSTNAFFMNITTKSLLANLAHSPVGTWTLPVNLRPILKRGNIESNHSSGLLININEADGPAQTHQIISQSLKEKQHWGIWWVHQIGKFIGLKGMRWISNRNAKKSFLIGSFSNLSSWELPPNEIWIGSPPGSKNFPISVMVMKANKRISYCLKIHPFILKDQTQTPYLLQKLRKDIAIAIE